MQVYIYYPKPHITVHRDTSCRQIQMHQKEDGRHVKVRLTNFNDVLTKFINEDYEF